jgi:hypothetical protein
MEWRLRGGKDNGEAFSDESGQVTKGGKNSDSQTSGSQGQGSQGQGSLFQGIKVGVKGQDIVSQDIVSQDSQIQDSQIEHIQSQIIIRRGEGAPAKGTGLAVDSGGDGCGDRVRRRVGL